MSTTMDDVIADMAFNDYYEEHQSQHFRELSKLHHCVYLLVEGHSEEVAYPILFSKSGYDYEENGILICNYNGAGNAIHSIFLLRSTLSNKRPIIITFDNDEIGSKKYEKLLKLKDDITFPFLLPTTITPVIYSHNHHGGSFEELFKKDDFINACFSDDTLSQSYKNDFARNFDTNKEWFKQLTSYCFTKKINLSSANKIKISEKLAKLSEEVPIDFKNLIELIKKIRSKFPIEDISKFDLPKPWPGF